MQGSNGGVRWGIQGRNGAVLEDLGELGGEEARREEMAGWRRKSGIERIGEGSLSDFRNISALEIYRAPDDDSGVRIRQLISPF